MEEINEDFIRNLHFEQNKTHAEMSWILKEMFPGERGFSERSVRRYCLKHDIIRGHIASEELEEHVRRAVAQLGPTWGRKMVQGFLRSKGINAGAVRIGKCLSIISPAYLATRRSNAERNINPVPYKADYFGHKLHLDQNEKLSMYGLTHVCASDGYSGKLVAFATMPVKNNALIYEHVYRRAVMEHGMWDQIRVDHGGELFLTLFVQDKLADFRYNTRRAPFIQTMSKENHPAERKWVEFNARVNYPIKRVLNEMVKDDQLNMEDDIVKFSVSYFTTKVAAVGIKQVFDSWNQHTIPGKGIPDNIMKKSCKALPLSNPDILPSVEEAVSAYNENEGHLSLPSTFGIDLLGNHDTLQQERMARFHDHIPDFEVVFHSLVNGNPTLFRQGLQYFTDLTISLYSDNY